MPRSKKLIPAVGSTDPAAHESFRTSYLAQLVPHRPADRWQFAQASAEFYGPFVTLSSLTPRSYLVFYTEASTRELMALLRASHELHPEEERATLLAVPTGWYPGRHWKSLFVDGAEVIVFTDENGALGPVPANGQETFDTIAALSREERGTLLATYDEVIAHERSTAVAAVEPKVAEAAEPPPPPAPAPVVETPQEPAVPKRFSLPVLQDSAPSAPEVPKEPDKGSDPA